MSSDQDSGNKGSAGETELPRVYVEKTETQFKSLALTLGLLFATTVLIAIFVSWSFGWVAVESHTPTELYSRILDGRLEVRRMSAIEWAQQLGRASAGQVDAFRPTPDQSLRLAEIVAINRDWSTPPDAKLLGAVATVLGYSTNSVKAREALIKFLNSLEPTELEEVQIFAILALARLGPDRAEEFEVFLNRVRHSDESVRKAVAYAMGSVLLKNAGTPNLVEALREGLKVLLNDETADVRWNASFALARAGDNTGLPVLTQVLTEASTAAPETITQEKLDLYLEALRVSGQIKAPDLRNLLREMAQKHPNLRIRQAAKELQF